MNLIFDIGTTSVHLLMRNLAAQYRYKLQGSTVLNKKDHLIVKYNGFEFKVDPRINICVTGKLRVKG